VLGKITLGGEHVFDRNTISSNRSGYFDSWVDKISKDFNVQYTFGGYYSLVGIIESLKTSSDKEIELLLPSYLCPSMLKPFKNWNVNYSFYKVDQSLYVDETHLRNQISAKTTAVLFIDYFGTSQVRRLSGLIHELKNKNIQIIQDIVQTIDLAKAELYGDFVFNSVRKFLPVEASILLSKEAMNTEFGHSMPPVQKKRRGQFLRKISLKTGIDLSFAFLPDFKRFESEYYQRHVVRLPEKSRKYLSQLDFEKLIWEQRFYYEKLVQDYGNLQPQLLRHQSSTVIPLGLVLSVKDRNEFRNFLFGKRIFAPIHWVLSEEIDKKEYEGSWSLSEEIITIPLINLTERKFKYLTETLDEYFKG